MSVNKDTFFLSTPIYYVNDAPHIGHAYTTVAGDVLTRWRRQRGEKVWYLTGTDEHGTKVQRAAEANNVTPKEWVDKLVDEAWKPVLKTIDAANDDFIRTTEERHIKGVQKFWEIVKSRGHIYQAEYQGPYCVGCEEFKLPGDLLEVDGKQVCPVHGKPVEILSENNWFFKLSEFGPQLLEHYQNNPSAIQPESAYNEVISFIKQGLVDISMSRSAVSWGIKLPWEQDQVVYVWFDALLNYATAIGFESDKDSFEKIWPADVHLVGKDILRFHAVYWPAMLLAAGLPLPKCVFAHGWLLVGGEKMSKTKLTGIAPSQIVDYVGSDAFRYYFLSAIKFGQDGSFSWEDLTARYKAELANGLGNLASRLTAMVEKYFDTAIPKPAEYLAADKKIIDFAVAQARAADEAMIKLDFSTGITHIRNIVDATNLYITEQEPWKVAKDPEQKARLATILYLVAELLRIISVLYYPVMPKASQNLWSAIGAEEKLGKVSKQLISSTFEFGLLSENAKTHKGEALFPQLAEDE
jgi:methionyl-tRNA synthetase